VVDANEGLYSQGEEIMFRTKMKAMGMVALTLAILVGSLSLSATNVVFAADQSTKPASLPTQSAARLRMCNLDGDHDKDDWCRVIHGRYFFGNGYFMGNGYAMGNRYLFKNFDTDSDVVFPYYLGPYPNNYPWWWQ
jgi:hypothetical protein